MEQNLDNYIDVIKKKTGQTQLSIASEINYSREHFSRSKKSAPSFLLKKLMSVFGFVRPGDESYDRTLQDLKFVVNVVTKQTSMSIEDISDLIYGKKQTITESLNGDWVSPRMTLAIKSKFQNLFVNIINEKILVEQDIVLNTVKNNEDLISCSLVYTLSDPIDSLALKQGDQLFGSVININDKLFPNKIYALKTITDQVFIGHLKKLENSITIIFDQKEIEPETISILNIKSLHIIQFALKRI